MRKLSNFDFKKIHFVGAGGISMSALIKYCINKGAKVSGSDKKNSEQIALLKSLGAKINIGHNSKNLSDADAIVYSSAISLDNPELKNSKKIKVYKRSEFLNEIASSYKTSIAVSGSHGKTTTTSMIAHILSLAGKAPTAFIGGEDFEYGNFLSGVDDYFVYEACEYKKNILDYTPKIAIVLNVDNDHLESYGSMQNMISAFEEFTNKRLSIINSDDINSKQIINSTSVTFGIKNNANYTAKNIRKNKLGYSFTVYNGNLSLGRINLSIAGKHNIYNALASISVANILGISFNYIKKSLESFKGVKRRMELLANVNGSKFFADYAHHPNEISRTLEAFSVTKDDLVIFQPHTYSRTKLLLNDFIKVFASVDNLIIYKTYSAREKYDKNGCSYTLYNNLKKIISGEVNYAKNTSVLFEILGKKCGKYKRLFFLGAGDIYDKAVKYIKSINF